MNKSELKMKAARRRFLQIMTGAVASPAISRLAMAETYPARPVHLVVPVPPGGTFDIVGRLVAAALSERLGQQVVVDNRDGVATAIGTGFVAHAQPDGYTLLLAGSPAAINESLYPNLDFRFTRDIAPVASIERAPLIMVVNTALPPKDVREFIDYAKAHPKTNIGSGGIGSTGDVAAELFNQMSGLKMTHVPYRGEAPAVADLLAGQTQVVFSTPGSVVGFIKAGTLRALAVTSAGRMDVFPRVPAIAETVPGYEAVSWAGLGAPAATPRDIVDRLNKETNAVLGDAKVQERLAEFGAVVMTGSPDDFGKFIAEEVDKWGKVTKSANMKAG